MSATIHALLPKVMADVGAVAKTKTNSQQGFKFRGIDDVMTALHPALAKHGVIVVPDVEERLEDVRTTAKGGALFVVKLKVRYTFYGPEGDSVSAVVWGEAMDSADKATNKALSAAMKYALLQTFCIPTEDADDGDGDNHQVAAPTAVKKQSGPAPRKRVDIEKPPALQQPDDDTDRARAAAAKAVAALELLPDEVKAALQSFYSVDSVDDLDAKKAWALSAALAHKDKAESFMQRAMEVKSAQASWSDVEGQGG